MVVTNSTVTLALINVYHKGVFEVMWDRFLFPDQNNLCNWSSSVEPPLLSTSAGIPSFPGDFPDAVCLRARSISVTDGTSSRCVAVGHCGISESTWVSKLISD